MVSTPASRRKTAGITVGGAVNDYLQGKSPEEVLLNAAFSGGAGEIDQYTSKYTKTNPDIMSALFAAGADTMIDKNDAEEEKSEWILISEVVYAFYS